VKVFRSHAIINALLVQAVTVNSLSHAFLSPLLSSLAVIVFWAHNMLVTCAHPSFLPTLLFTFSTTHYLCSSCTIFISTPFPTQHFHATFWINVIFSSVLCKVVLLPSHNTLMPQSLKPSWWESARVLQHSHFSDNGSVVTQDWVGQSYGGERLNMGRIRRGWIVCDLRSHVDMNLTAFCSHRLSCHHHVHISRCQRFRDQRE